MCWEYQKQNMRQRDGNIYIRTDPFFTTVLAFDQQGIIIRLLQRLNSVFLDVIVLLLLTGIREQVLHIV